MTNETARTAEAAGKAPSRGAIAFLLGVRAGASRLLFVGAGMTGGLAIATAVDPAFSSWPWVWAAIATLLLACMRLLAGAALRRSPAPSTRVSARQAQRAGADLDLAAVVSAFPDPCVAVDRRGVVLATSPATAALFPTIIVGRPLSFAIRAPEFVEALEAVLNGASARTVHLNQRVPVERSFEIVTTPLDGDRRRGALVVLRDLTGQQRVEQMRVDFIANASHELRTPLATVMGFIETLQGPARNDPVARERFLVIMREQSLRMKRLIDDLLSLSRIEGRTHHAPSAPVDVVDVASQIVDSLRPMAGEAGVALGFDAPDTPVVVPGDRDELLRVVENLVENAVKYGSSGERVDVSVSLRSGSESPEGQAAGANAGADMPPIEVVIAVRDFGPGIASEHVPRLTERFYRVDAQASRGKGGSGLGLAIVKHIVNRHRGRLHIESAPATPGGAPQGAVFRVVLPLAHPPGRAP